MQYFLDIPKNVEAIKKRYFEMALKLHPDKGGQTEQFIELKRQRDIAMRHAKNPYGHRDFTMDDVDDVLDFIVHDRRARLIVFTGLSLFFISLLYNKKKA